MPLTSTPDRGSSFGGKVAWVVGILAFVAVVLLQQGFFEPKSPHSQSPTSAMAAPALGDPFVQSAKMMVRLKSFFGAAAQSDGQALLDMTGKPGASRVDKFRHAIVAAELAGADVARKELEDVAKAEATTGTNSLSAEETARLDEQIASMRTILDGQSSALSSKQRDDLVADHGYLGELLLSFGKPDADPNRAPLVAGGGYMALLVVLFLCILVVGGLGGLSACIAFFVMLGNGKIKRRFTAPAPGGSVYLETVALFLGSFLLLQLVTHLLLPPEAINIKLLSQWLLLLVPLWPLARGVAAKDWRAQLGLTSSKSLLHEVGVGIFAYFASIPFIAIALAIVIVYTLAKSHSDPSAGPPHNPIQDLVGQGDSTTLVLVFLLATIWAPLTEEMVFRGAFFRHLRGRLGVFAAAAISALVFGFMHGYALALLLPVITLGFTFALTREWRGSLIAPMVGHFLHNATLLTLAILLVLSGK